MKEHGSGIKQVWRRPGIKVQSRDGECSNRELAKCFHCCSLNSWAWLPSVAACRARPGVNGSGSMVRDPYWKLYPRALADPRWDRSFQSRRYAVAVYRLDWNDRSQRGSANARGYNFQYGTRTIDHEPLTPGRALQAATEGNQAQELREQQ